jgi:hypothetical protein
MKSSAQALVADLQLGLRGRRTWSARPYDLGKTAPARSGSVTVSAEVPDSGVQGSRLLIATQRSPQRGRNQLDAGDDRSLTNGW